VWNAIAMSPIHTVVVHRIPRKIPTSPATWILFQIDKYCLLYPLPVCLGWFWWFYLSGYLSIPLNSAFNVEKLPLMAVFITTEQLRGDLYSLTTHMNVVRLSVPFAIAA
jgi:hypothetical protein